MKVAGCGLRFREHAEIGEEKEMFLWQSPMNVLFLQRKQLNRRIIMAMSIKSIPVLTGQAAANFVAEADNNKNQATPALSEKAAERLKKVLEKSKTFTF